MKLPADLELAARCLTLKAAYAVVGLCLDVLAGKPDRTPYESRTAK